jgi:hypothetical protein
LTPLAVLLVALVAEDPTYLRSAPSDSAPAQATLHRGDWLEVRGQVPGFLKVWDRRRERPGYVRPNLVRLHRAEEASADELRSVVRFLREANGYESLGVGYAALYLRVAPPARRRQPEWAEVLSALGTMADRLATRASGTRASAARRGESDATLAGQLAVIESYGVGLRRFEQGERTVVCYDGDAFARVLSLAAAAAEERARAALALTRRACFDPATAVQHGRAWNEARLTVLDEASPSRPEQASLPRPLAYRLRLRRADALSERAHRRAASADLAGAAQAAAEALRQLALVDRGELAPEDQAAHAETAVRVAGVRWLTGPLPPPAPLPLRLQINAGGPGQTCVRLWSEGVRPTLLIERCTFGVVFASSLQVATGGRALAIVVAPVPAWTELWIFRQEPASAGWRADVIPPAAGEPGQDVGYVELAGFSPDGRRALVVREYCLADRPGRRFEVLSAEGAVLHWAGDAGRLAAFARWASPTWRRSTLALR